LFCIHQTIAVNPCAQGVKWLVVSICHHHHCCLSVCWHKKC